MSLIKTLVGTLAVLLSIQPLASWAASSSQNTSKSASAQDDPNPKSDVITIFISHGESTRGDGGPPTCGGG